MRTWSWGPCRVILLHQWRFRFGGWIDFTIVQMDVEIDPYFPMANVTLGLLGLIAQVSWTLPRKDLIP